MLYGNLPKDLGMVVLNPSEMMFWMYCPIKVINSYHLVIPDNLKQFQPIMDEVFRDIKFSNQWEHEFNNPWYNSYIYITAKTLWVSGTYIGNRPGYHSDGFGTDDINYIWYDRAPTEFLKLEHPQTLPTDCNESMMKMEDWACFPFQYESSIVTYPEKHLLRLDESVVHRSPYNFHEGMRTFVKISVSKHKYDLVGNSINHMLNVDWEMKERTVERNHPSSESIGM